MTVIAIAFTLGTLLGYYLMAELNGAVYPDEIPLKSWPVAITMFLMIFSIAFTIATQLQRLLKENPINTLRSE